MKQKNNVPKGGVIKQETFEGHDRALGKLPRRLSRFVEFEATVPFNLEDVLDMAARYGEERTLRYLREDLGEMCGRLYGPGHPNVKWEPMKSPHRLPPKTGTRSR
jgi:hypothetical protein